MTLSKSDQCAFLANIYPSFSKLQKVSSDIPYVGHLLEDMIAFEIAAYVIKQRCGNIMKKTVCCIPGEQLHSNELEKVCRPEAAIIKLQGNLCLPSNATKKLVSKIN